MSEPKKIVFDRTINLGHVLTFIGFITSGFTIWQAMDKRVIVLEEARVAQKVIDGRQDAEIIETRRTVREDLKEINQKLDRLIERKQ